MTVIRTTLLAAAGALALAACSKPAAQATTAPPLQPLAATNPATPTAPATAAAPGTAYAAAAPGVDPATGAPYPPASNSYSCNFPGPTGRSILARFALDASGGAHDDQGMPFTVIDNSPSALVLAHARDNLGAAPDGDVGAYVVAIDRRTLGMVQSTVGLNGPDATRRGRCIAG